MVNARDVRSDEVDSVTKLQYLSCHLLEEMNRKGFVKGDFPKRGILTSDERMLFNRMERDGAFSNLHDEQIARGIALVCLGLNDLGFTFTLDVSHALRSIVNE